LILGLSTMRRTPKQSLSANKLKTKLLPGSLLASSLTRSAAFKTEPLSFRTHDFGLSSAEPLQMPTLLSRFP
jgi:hypothetical protein